MCSFIFFSRQAGQRHEVGEEEEEEAEGGGKERMLGKDAHQQEAQSLLGARQAQSKWVLHVGQEDCVCVFVGGAVVVVKEGETEERGRGRGCGCRCEGEEKRRERRRVVV
jgi:hypothetical protein